MHPLILHHHDLSPFGEKVRLAFGHKTLDFSALSAADLSAYGTLWFARPNGGADAEAMLPLAAPLRAFPRARS